MAISVVQSVAHVGNPPATFGSNITLGNTVVIVAAGYTTTSGNPSTGTVRLAGGVVPGTVALFNPGTTGGILSPISGGNGAYICIWILPNVQLAAQTVVQMTFTGASGVIGQAIYEVAGLGTGPILDVSSSGSAGTGTAVSSGAAGPITSATEIVFGGTMAFVGTPATNSGWICLQPGGGADLTAGYQIPVAAGGSYTWSQTSSGSPWSAFAAAIKPSPVPAPFYPVTLVKPRLGVPLPKGRALSSPGAPVNNPGVVPVKGSMSGAIRAALPSGPGGRLAIRTLPSGPQAPVSTNGAAASVTVTAPAGAASSVVQGAAANVTATAPGGPASSVVQGAVASITANAPAGAASSSGGTGSTLGPAVNILVAAPAGTAQANGSTTPLTVRAATAFRAYTSVTAQATMGFKAGVPVQAGLTTLASDPWTSMYPG